MKEEVKERIHKQLMINVEMGRIDGTLEEVLVDIVIDERRAENKKTTQAILKQVDEMNNFRQAKIDGKKEWNDAIEQCAAKVDALIQSLKSSL